MGITAKLCEKIVATNWNDLSEEAIHRTRRIILDGIAVAVAGTIQEEAPEVLAKHVKKLGGTPDSTVIDLLFLLISAIDFNFSNANSLDNWFGSKIKFVFSEHKMISLLE